MTFCEIYNTKFDIIDNQWYKTTLNGTIGFPIPENMGLDTKIVPLSQLQIELSLKIWFHEFGTAAILKKM